MSKAELISSADLLLDDRFVRWLEGSSYDIDNQWVEGLMASSTAQEDEVADAVSFYNSIRRREKDVPDFRPALDRLLSKIEVPQPSFKLNKKRNAIPSLGRKRSLVAALALAVGIVFFLWIQFFQSSSEKSLSVSSEKQQLVDGTLVQLAGNSTLTLSSDFASSSNREVWINGRVEFQVKKKNSNVPFIVHMDPFDVVVTGTTFQAVNDPAKASVLLREGNVSLLFRDGSVMQMKPGDFYEYSKLSNPVNKRGVAQTDIIPRIERKLVIEDLTIAEVVQQIQARYPVTITIVSPKLSMRRLTGILPNDNLKDLINALELATESSLIPKGDTLFFVQQSNQ